MTNLYTILLGVFVLLIPISVIAQERSTVANESSAQKDSGKKDYEIISEEIKKEDAVEPRAVANRAPDSIAEEITQAEITKKSVIDYDPFGFFVRPWKKYNKKLTDWAGLDLVIAYTALYQVASNATQKDKINNAAGGILDFSGRLEVLSEKGSYPGYIGFRSSTKHRLFTDITPSQLAENIGSLWRTDGDFSKNNFFISQLWWEQHIFNDKVVFRVGKILQIDYIDSFNFSSSKLFFINSAFSDNPTIPFPDNGLGGAILFQPNETVYMLASIGDANAKSATFDFGTFFGEGEFFYGVEIGVLPQINRLGKGNYHVAYWHSDRRKKKKIPSGNGIAITLQQDLGRDYSVFIRYSLSNGSVTNLKMLASGGVGIYDPLRLGYDDNLLGFALAWGEPEQNGLRAQYVMESFLRIQLFPSVQITPDIQLIIHPSEAPEQDLVAVFGMRFRLAF